MISICLELSIVCSAGHFTDYKIISNVKTPMYAYFWVRITRTRPAILVLTGSLGVSLEAGVWSREFFYIFKTSGYTNYKNLVVQTNWSIFGHLPKSWFGPEKPEQYRHGSTNPQNGCTSV